MATNEASSLRRAVNSGTALLMEGRVVEGSQALAEALSHGESAELWNDWAVGQLMLAEKAFRRALEMEPTHGRAAANLGVLLFSIGKHDVAAEFLERALSATSGAVRAHIRVLLGLCGKRESDDDQFGTVDRAGILRQVQLILEEYFLRGNRSEAIVAPPGYDPHVEAQPAWIEETLRKGIIHDEDFLVFGAFQDPESTILDIGAHFGYSAASIWSCGSAARVISFEANASFECCLKHLVTLRPGRYDYRIMALGEATGVPHFVMPVLNGYGIGALATANASPNLPCLAENVVDHLEKHCNGQPFSSFRIHAFGAPVARLDDLLQPGGFCVPTDRIVAMKIDTEGHEGQVLSGCPELLTAQRPLVLCEGGHSNPLVCQQLLGAGYVYARRENRRLEVVSEPAAGVNGFFLHPEQRQEYQRIGLLRT